MNEQAKNTETKNDEQKKEIQTQQPQTMEAFLLSAQTRIDKILPSTMKDNGITPEKFILTALTEIRKNPMLATCDRASIALCIINAAELGLQVGATLGQAYLVPYSNKGKMEAQFQIGYKGLLELVRRSGKIKRISCHVVREGDHFDYCFGINEKLEHRPESDNKKITHAYALVEFIGGGHQFDVMTIDEILKIKSKSKSGNSDYSPWNTFFEEMAKKTVIKRLCKMLPQSIEKVQEIIAKDEEDFYEESATEVKKTNTIDVFGDV